MSDGALGGEAPDAALDRARRVAIDALVEHFAQDHLRAEEFERRVAIARNAGSIEEARGALADLPGRGTEGWSSADVGAA